jgi:hypothetical protein
MRGCLAAGGRSGCPVLSWMDHWGSKHLKAEVKCDGFETGDSLVFWYYGKKNLLFPNVVH